MKQLTYQLHTATNMEELKEIVKAMYSWGLLAIVDKTSGNIIIDIPKELTMQDAFFLGAFIEGCLAGVFSPKLVQKVKH